MKEFFDTFEAELQSIEDKLDILSEWLMNHSTAGAYEIADDARGAITSAWIDFTKLREEHEKQEQSHEEIVESNIKYLLGELYEHEAEIAKLLKYDKVDTLLFDLLAKYSRVALYPNVAKGDEGNIHSYLLQLVVADLKERGIIEKIVRYKGTNETEIIEK
ncbi:Uncharacterised protein [Chlamydia trachomatis]|nr:Uncharacterised protein [Chlamydia trachomatis]